MSRTFRRTAIHLGLAASALFAAGPGLAQAPAVPASPPDAATKVEPGISPDVFYRLLLGDIALQRGEPALAARAYYEVARETSDARLARRSAEIAFATRQRATADAAARLWSNLEPTAERPRQILAALEAGGPSAGGGGVLPGTQDDLKVRLEKFLAEQATSGAGVGDAFIQLNRAFAQQTDKAAVLELVKELAQPYPSSPEANFAVSLAAFNVGEKDAAADKLAREAVERSLALKPDWERAALLKAEIIARKSNDDAVAWLKAYLATQPTSRPVRGALAQFYVEQKKLGEARAIFETLAAEDPETREYAMGVAILSFQMKDWTRAEAEFGRLAAKGDDGGAQLYLAQIAEETKRYDVAFERYRAVTEGERAWLAKLRAAAMLGKMNRVDEGRRYLADLPAVTIEQRVQVRQAEASLLREAGRLNDAYGVLEQALREHPDNTDLLYDSAMVAEKVDRIDVAEARLKRILEVRPNDAQALNALGYTLVDRTSRIEEGRVLIEKALVHAPDDPFIQDSMGWALFKLGRYDEAETWLKRAFELRPDAEIAAHLGEVLWTKGEREKAKALWAAQLQTSPDHPVLLETVKRLSR